MFLSPALLAMGSIGRGSTNFARDSGSRAGLADAAPRRGTYWSAAYWSAEYLRKRRRVDKQSFKNTRGHAADWSVACPNETFRLLPARLAGRLPTVRVEDQAVAPLWFFREIEHILDRVRNAVERSGTQPLSVQPVVFHEAYDRGLIRHRVVDEVGFGVRRNHQHRKPRTISAAALCMGAL